MGTIENKDSVSQSTKRNRVFHLHSSNPNNTNQPCIRIDSNRVYTIGRKRRHCDIIVDNRFVSKRHCQIFHNLSERRLELTDGCLLDKRSDFAEKVSLNGVFVNGKRVEKGCIVELRDKDEILIGMEEKFIVEESKDEAFEKMCDRVVLAKKAVSILGKCQSISNSTDPVSYLRNLDVGNSLIAVDLKQSDVNEVKFSREDATDCNLKENVAIDLLHSYRNGENGTVKDFDLKSNVDMHVYDLKDSDRTDVKDMENRVGETFYICNDNVLREATYSNNLDNNDVKITKNAVGKRFVLNKNAAIEVIILDDSDQYEDKNVVNDVILDENVGKDEDKIRKGIDSSDLTEESKNNYRSNGKTFFLNRLENMEQGNSEHEAKIITLPELLHPVESLVGIFLATFTNDVAWFLSYCQLPYHLPITIACHCAEKCWSSSRENRTSAPFSYYPNLLLV